ncbi:acyl-CoA N-acyltransferase [Auriculariales sp. MPI-PUGE-AT-0066]|nr:acyl-CoA N-acyltransferase [Auriculariales sp. MPI-PUGE-AT-0066]
MSAVAVSLPQAPRTWALRPVTDSDVETMARLFCKSRNKSVPGRDLGDYYDWDRDMAPGGKLRARFEKLLKEDRGRIVMEQREHEELSLGFAAMRPASAETGGKAELTYLFVDPEQQGRGLGSALIKWVLDEARADARAVPDKTARCTVACFARNPAGIRAYTRGGFVQPPPGSELMHPEVNEPYVILEWVEKVDVCQEAS